MFAPDFGFGGRARMESLEGQSVRLAGADDSCLLRNRLFFCRESAELGWLSADLQKEATSQFRHYFELRRIKYVGLYQRRKSRAQIYQILSSFIYLSIFVSRIGQGHGQSLGYKYVHPGNCKDYSTINQTQPASRHQPLGVGVT